MDVAGIGETHRFCPGDRGCDCLGRDRTDLWFSDTWQLVINTGTTIVTFFMVFLLQNTQYRDSEAIQIKLDELIRATEGAHNALLELEELSQAELDHIKAEYRKLAEKARKDLKKGKGDTGVPDVKT